MIPELPPLQTDQRKTDQKHLKLLSIFHFIGSGLALFGMGFLALHFTIMRTVFSNPQFLQNQKAPMPPADLFAMLKWFYLALGTWFLISLALNLASAICLLSRKHRKFSIVVAGFDCLHMPLGTILGVFTILVLVRDSVRESYEQRQPLASAAGDKP